MKKTVNRILTLMLVCIAAASCQGSKVDPEFVGTNTTGLTVKGQKIFVFDSMNCQTSFKRESCEYRSFTDNMSDYYCVRLEYVPTQEGQKVKGELKWTSKSEILSKKGLSFTVEKTDRSGRLWLWCRKESIGVLVQTLN